jgi:hypothetical protein
MPKKSEQVKKTVAALKFLGFRAKVQEKASTKKLSGLTFSKDEDKEPKTKKLGTLCESLQSASKPAITAKSPMAMDKSMVSGPLSPKDVLYRSELWLKSGEPPEGTIVRWSDGHDYLKLAVGWSLMPDSSNPNMGGPKADEKDTPPKANPEAEHPHTPAEHSADPGTQDKITQNSDKKNVAEPFPKGPAYVEGSMDGAPYHVMKQDTMGIYKSVSTHTSESDARRAVQTHTDHEGRVANPNFLHSMVRWEQNVRPGHEVHLKFEGGSARARVTKVNEGSVKARLMHDTSSPLTAHFTGAEVTVPRATSALKDPTSKWNKGNGVFPITELTPKVDVVKWAAIGEAQKSNGHAQDYRVGDILSIAFPSGQVHEPMVVEKVAKIHNRITLKHGLPGEGKDGYVLDMAGFAGKVTKRSTAPIMKKNFKI